MRKSVVAGVLLGTAAVATLLTSSTAGAASVPSARSVTVCVVYSERPTVGGPVPVYGPSYVTTNPNDPKCDGDGISIPLP